MKPGRELDVLIAEKVMDLTRLHESKSKDIAPQTMSNFKASGYYGPYYRTQDDRMRMILPAYSTEIAAAWSIVGRDLAYEEVLNDDGELVSRPINISAVIRIEDGRWLARFDGAINENEMPGYYERSCYPDGAFAVGESPAHAICLAALKAVGHNLDSL